jgi:hypothetical protein
MGSSFSNTGRILASIGIVLIGVAAGPVAAFVTLMVCSTGEGEDWGGLGALFFFAPVALVIGAAVGICLIIFSLIKIWSKDKKPD